MDALSKITTIFTRTIQMGSSDLHIVPGEIPVVRVDGKLKKLPDESPLSKTDSEEIIGATLRPEYASRLKSEKEVDFSFNYDGARVRANIYLEKKGVAGSFRFIPQKIRSLEDLGLPPVFQDFANREQGLVIVTGPTGHGKSTTIAALIEHINNNFSRHIITIEDPVEYVFENKKSIVTQRELGTDTLSFSRALRSALREDPDVVFIGEMRDFDTFEAALTIAETGHLVLSTLHTNDASQAPDRIIDASPKNQHEQVRQQVANVLTGVVSQRLIPKASGQGRVVACEVMVANNAVRSVIREGKSHQLPSIIQTGASEGMISLDKVLANLVSTGEITLEEALNWTNDAKNFKQMVF